MYYRVSLTGVTPPEGSDEARNRDNDISIFAQTTLQTHFGDFEAIAFRNKNKSLEHLALVKGELGEGDEVLVRLHSECLTGDVLGSQRCDCGEQLLAALERIGASKRGVLLYLRQEGRGIGLANKVKAYALQSQGLDTVEANHQLGFRDDGRNYSEAAAMLQALGIKSVRLITNNPRKIKGLESSGIKVSERVASHVDPNRHNQKYLQTKQEKLGHFLQKLNNCTE